MMSIAFQRSCTTSPGRGYRGMVLAGALLVGSTAFAQASSGAAGQVSPQVAPHGQDRGGASRSPSVASGADEYASNAAPIVPPAPWRQSDESPDLSHIVRAAAAVTLTLVVGVVWFVLRRRVVGKHGGAMPARSPSWRAWMTQTSGRHDPIDDLSVRQSARIGAAATAYVVRWDGREWLVGSSAAGLTVLAERHLRTAGAVGEPDEAQRARDAEAHR